MAYLISYGCSTAAGNGVEALWQGLNSDAPQESFLWRDRPENSNEIKDYLVKKLLVCWDECLAGVSVDLKEKLTSDLGIIVASTKGCLEEYIWQEIDLQPYDDPIHPILESFIARAQLNPNKKIGISNACSSSHGAVYLAKEWLESGLVENVLVLSVDFIGPFISRGFESLKAISSREPKPFSGNRDGLRLGDGAAAIMLSATSNTIGLKVAGTALLAVGENVTRPNLKACTRTLKQTMSSSSSSSSVTAIPDLIIAHGTATKANDLTEDQAFKELFGLETPPITATKWRVGHTMSVSGAIDLIAAAESIRRQKAFAINQQEMNDPSFSSRYLRPRSALFPKNIKKVLVNSMGFGGIHSSFLVEQSDDTLALAKHSPTNKATPRLFGKIYTHQPHFLLENQPTWSHLVKRWYQLDLAARSLIEFQNYWTSQNPSYLEITRKAEVFVFASSEASNATDRHFAGDGGVSPSLFTHTLPNIRAAALFEAIGWEGPLFCLQAGPRTVIQGIIEASELMLSKNLEFLSFVGMIPKRSPKHLKTLNYSIIQLLLSSNPNLLRHQNQGASVTVFKPVGIQDKTSELDDAMLCDWLLSMDSANNKSLYLGDNCWMKPEFE